MRIGTKLVAIASHLLCTTSEAAHHPFVGEHADASAVHHENGSISQRMTARPAAYNKHAEYMVKEGDVFAKQEEGVIGRFSRAIYGQSNTEFEKRVRDF